MYTLEDIQAVDMEVADAITKEFDLEDNRRITFLTTDNENGIFAGIDNDGICDRFVHTKHKIKIIVHGGLLPTDILHHLTGL